MVHGTRHTQMNIDNEIHFKTKIINIHHINGMLTSKQNKGFTKIKVKFTEFVQYYKLKMVLKC